MEEQFDGMPESDVFEKTRGRDAGSEGLPELSLNGGRGDGEVIRDRFHVQRLPVMFRDVGAYLFDVSGLNFDTVRFRICGGHFRENARKRVNSFGGGNRLVSLIGADDAAESFLPGGDYG